MKDIWNWIQTAFAVIGGMLGWYLGGVDGFLYTLIAFVVVDYITGVLRAIVEKKLSSQIGAHGIAKKVALFLVVGIGHLIDTYLISSTGAPLRTAVIFFYLSNEGVSLLENAGHLGLPIPAKLKAVLEQLHDRSEKEDK